MNGLYLPSKAVNHPWKKLSWKGLVFFRIYTSQFCFDFRADLYQRGKWLQVHPPPPLKFELNKATKNYLSIH